MDTLAAQREWSQLWVAVANAAERIKNAIPELPIPPIPRPASQQSEAGLQGPLAGAGRLSAGIAGLGPFTTTTTPTPSTIAADLALMRRWTSVLGDALTPSELLRQKILELNAAQEQGAITDSQRARALGAFTRAQEAAAITARVGIGVATQAEQLSVRLRELDDAQAKGFIRNNEERAAAERLVRREVEETAKSLLVRNSVTPSLTRLALDADNLTASLDSGLSSALRGATATMREMLSGTKSLSQGFSELTSRITDAVTEALIMKSIVGPISGAISSGISTLFPSADGNVFSGGTRLTAFADGGVVTRPTVFRMANGMGLMGEAGPEAVMPLRRLGNGRLGVEAAGGGDMNVYVINNHSGARVSQKEDRDGRGNRRLQVVIEEMVAAAAGRPGSPVRGALLGAGAFTRL